MKTQREHIKEYDDTTLLRIIEQRRTINTITINSTPNDTSTLLRDLNDEKAMLMLPVILILTILMITGLLGNGMVCFYYGCKTKRTTSSVFIVVLAVFDIITCSISVPIEIVDLRFFYDFENEAACKMMRFVNHFAAIASASTLMAIAIDRFKRICYPFKKQFNLKDTKIACAVAVCLAVLFSWPACVFYGAVKVNVKNDYGVQVIGTDCTTTKDEAARIALLVFNGTHFVIFIACVLTLIVLYCKIGRVLYLHSKHRQTYATAITANGNTDHDPVATDSSDLSEDKLSRDMTQSTPGNGTHHTPNKRHSFRISDNTRSPKTTVGKSPDIKTVKYTMIMLVITIVFVVSFLPYLSLVIWRIFLGKYEGDVLSDSGLVAFQIGIRSYMLNSVINPITYGFFNSRFRSFFLRYTLSVLWTWIKGDNLKF